MKKPKHIIQASCDICRYRVIDPRWGCYKCYLGEKMPGIKFKQDETGNYRFCHAFEKKGK